MKSKEELIKQFKKANQGYKWILAGKAGFTSKEDYLNFLENKSKTKPKVVSSPIVKALLKPTIHIVDILDASGSMGGSGNSKYENSKKGILSGIEDLRKVKDVKYTYTLIEFVQSRNIKTHFYLAPLPTNITFHGATGNNTPLYSTVYDTLILLQNVNPTDKVLVKVFTDGGENVTYHYKKLAKDLIAELQEKNFTITIVATDEDMPGIIEDLNLDGSNTLAIKNNAEGFKKAFKMSSIATMDYLASVTKGEDVSKGFYKRTGNL